MTNFIKMIALIIMSLDNFLKFHISIINIMRNYRNLSKKKKKEYSFKCIDIQDNT